MPFSGAPDLEVVVVSYNVRELLRSCLRSVFTAAADEGLQVRVWVHDNAGSDGSADMVAAEFPDAELTRGEVNLGFAGATNAVLRRLGYPGAAMSAAPVLLLNPDTELRPGVLSLLLEDLRSLPRAAVIGPGLVYADGSLQHSAFRFPGLAQTALDLFPLHGRLVESALNGRYPREERRPWPHLCGHPLGAAMLLRTEAIREVGLLGEGYFMYSEEIDWCRRANRAGWEAWSDPRAVIMHHAGRSTGQAKGEMYVQLWRSRYRYFRKHHGPLYRRVVRALVRTAMAREMAFTVGQFRRGGLSREEYGRRMQVFRAVAGL